MKKFYRVISAKTILSGDMLHLFLTLAWPTMLEQLLQTAVQYIDTAMVGTLGTVATAAVGATSTVSWLFGSVLSALGVGFLAQISKACGAGKKEKASDIVAQATLVILVAGIILTVIPLSLSGKIPVWMHVEPSVQELSSKYFFLLYTPMLARAASIIYGTSLRAAGDTKTPMMAGIITNSVNVAGNFLLIYPCRTVTMMGLSFRIPGAGWGVLGAGGASAVSFLVGGIVVTRAVWRHRLISPKGKKLHLNKAILGPCLRVAFPNMLQRFGTSLGYVFFASMINSLGEVSTAAHTIANTVESAFYIPGYGMQTAAATLAGNAYGAKNRKQLLLLRRNALFVEIVLMLLSGGLLFVLAPFLMQLFSGDESVILLGSRVLRIVALSEPFYGISIILEGILQGLGKTVLPFVAGISSMWLVRICGTYILCVILGYGLEAAWGAMVMHNLTVCCVMVIYHLSRGWNPLRET